jgi:hypothetical protein
MLKKLDWMQLRLRLKASLAHALLSLQPAEMQRQLDEERISREITSSIQEVLIRDASKFAAAEQEPKKQ